MALRKVVKRKATIGGCIHHFHFIELIKVEPNDTNKHYWWNDFLTFKIEFV
jgi:hypothetical protein